MAMQHGPQAMGGLQGNIAALRSATAYNEMMQRAKMQREANRARMFNTILQGGINYGLQSQQLKARASLAGEEWDRRDESQRLERMFTLDKGAIDAGYDDYASQQDPTPEQRAKARERMLEPMKLKAEQQRMYGKVDTDLYLESIGEKTEAKTKAELKAIETLGPAKLKQYREELAAQEQAKREAQVRATIQKQRQQVQQTIMQTPASQVAEPYRAGWRKLQQERIVLDDPDNGAYTGADGGKRKREPGLLQRDNKWTRAGARLIRDSGWKPPNPTQQFSKMAVLGSELAKDPRFMGVMQQFPEMANSIWLPNSKGEMELLFNPYDAQSKKAQTAKAAQDAQPDLDELPGKTPINQLTFEQRAIASKAFDEYRKTKGNDLSYEQFTLERGFGGRQIQVENIISDLEAGIPQEKIARWLNGQGHRQDKIAVAMKQAQADMQQAQAMRQRRSAAIQEQQYNEKVRIEMQRQEMVQQMQKYKEQYPDLSKAPPDVQEWIRQVMKR